MAAQLGALVQADFHGCGPSSADEDLAGNDAIVERFLSWICYRDEDSRPRTVNMPMVQPLTAKDEDQKDESVLYR
jgi:hypothetical protein